MLKRIAATAGVAIFVFGAGAGVAQADGGHAYGKTAAECVAALPGAPSLGAAIQAGREAHPDAKMTAKTIAMSVHCAD